MMKFMSPKRSDWIDFTKLSKISWIFLIPVIAIVAVGLIMLYSASGGRPEVWFWPQFIRFGMGFVLLILVAITDLKVLFRFSYVFYVLGVALLLIVEIKGHIGMGAQRWINLGFINLQPSELIKLGMILAIARYCHLAAAETKGGLRLVFMPILLLGLPILLILHQPDLGTALLCVLVCFFLMFLAGAPLWVFCALGVSAMAMVPIAWQLLRSYQKQRVLTFLDPERDPLGAGYHIIQSKIALGSGGVTGKGFMQGTQSHLDFLPEKQTDFIFTMFAEEFGFIGGLILLGLYLVLVFFGILMSMQARSVYGKLVGMGVITHLFFSLFINIAMVMGLLPVVGEPLPLLSYGGSSLIVTMIGFGLLMSVYVHRDRHLAHGGTLIGL